MKTLTFRVAHRYLGFFLLGIMAIYAISGVVLVFRSTHVFKVEKVRQKVVASGLTPDTLSKALSRRGLRGVKQDGDSIRFEGGTYDAKTGEAVFSVWVYPPVLKQMAELHTANTEDTAYFLNVFFGFALLFFSVSSLWMFRPRTKNFTRGMIVTAAGAAFAVVVLLL